MTVTLLFIRPAEDKMDEVTVEKSRLMMVGENTPTSTPQQLERLLIN